MNPRPSFSLGTFAESCLELKTGTHFKDEKTEPQSDLREITGGWDSVTHVVNLKLASPKGHRDWLRGSKRGTGR